MKFSISTAAVPDWGLAETLGKAKELGFDGVEIHGPTGDHDAVAKAVAAGQGVKVACVSVPVRYWSDTNEDVVTAGVVESAVELARLVGSPIVRMDDAAGRRGSTAAMLAVEYAEFLRPLADYAAERGVTLVVENGATFRRAKDLWMLMDRMNHPGVGACWDVVSGVLAGESPYQSVPVLNRHIRHVHIGDAKVEGDGVTGVQLGDGLVGMKALITRLKGVGYVGYLSIGRVAGADAGAFLAEAIKRLKDWTKPPETKAKVPPKPVAKPAGAAAGVAAPAAAPKPVAPTASDAAPANA